MNRIKKMKSRLDPVFYRCVQDCNDTIMITGADGKIIYANPSWERLYGFRQSEYLGKTAKILHSGKHSEAFYKKMWRSISSPRTGYWRGEIVNRAKSGKLITVLLMITPYRSPSGSILGYMGIGTDISFQKSLERKIKVHESIEALRYFSERLAHEIGTTLAVIRGRAELMIDRATDTDFVSNGVRIVIEQVDRISGLIGHLLKFSRSGMVSKKERIRLIDKVEAVVAAYDRRIKGHSIELRLSISRDLIVLGDRKKLYEALGHLLENAIEAIEKSEPVSSGESHRIMMKGYRRRKKVLLEIQDTGRGIAQENLVKIFQPFFTTKDIGQGIGMGLTLASRWIEESGGEISAENRSEGALFTVILEAA